MNSVARPAAVRWRLQSRPWLALLPVCLLGGCASIDFDADDSGLIYFEPLPHLFYTVTDECVSSVSVVSIPGQQKRIAFKSGYGAATLSASFANGVITDVGQATDTKVPETITSIAALAGALALARGAEDQTASGGCSPVAMLYPLRNGVPGTPIRLPISGAL